MFRITTAYKEKLPTKSRKFKYPQFFWVPAVHHDGFGSKNLYSGKFNDCLKEAVDKTRGMKLLELSTWNRHDVTTCTNGSLNDSGLRKYWITINDAFQAWDKGQMKRMQQHSTRFQQFRRNDQFHWVSQDRCKLSRPSNK